MILIYEMNVPWYNESIFFIKKEKEMEQPQFCLDPQLSKVVAGLQLQEKKNWTHVINAKFVPKSRTKER